MSIDTIIRESLPGVANAGLRAEVRSVIGGWSAEQGRSCGDAVRAIARRVAVDVAKLEQIARAADAANTTADQVTQAAREAFCASRDATGDDGCALDAANEAIVALVGERTGTFDQETLTWTFDSEVTP